MEWRPSLSRYARVDDKEWTTFGACKVLFQMRTVYELDSEEQVLPLRCVVAA